jgi:hypothetical protein
MLAKKGTGIYACRYGTRLGKKDFSHLELHFIEEQIAAL